ncbi:MAG: PEP/pyruvate-binding domain-containing protein, partial [Candidatus Peregrinibacteria bacterium]
MFKKLLHKFSKRRRALVLWFNELGIKDVPLVGGKNASLGEMVRLLKSKGVRVPDGFAITAYAYHYMLEKAGLKDDIRRAMAGLNVKNIHSLKACGEKVRHIILNAPFPEDLKNLILDSYSKMEAMYGKNCDVAVRSSATAEDLPDASFAGQQETYLNIRGAEALLHACHKCFASLFTDRAIFYRVNKGFDHFAIGLSIGVQKMVRSDLAASGIMFSIDTETGFKNAVLINAGYGLGENLVQGAVNPDEYYVFKPTLKQGYKPILRKVLGEKQLTMTYSKPGSDSPVKNSPTPSEKRKKFSITDDEVLTLAKWAMIIEDHYKKPMDMEWAKDGKTGELFIVQARPETVQSQRDYSVLEEYHLNSKGKVLASGSPVGSKIGAGNASVILSSRQINDFKKGDVLITEMTDPD